MLALRGEELIQSVDGHELNAGRLVDFLRGHFPEDFLHDSFGSAGRDSGKDFAATRRVLPTAHSPRPMRQLRCPPVPLRPSRESLSHFEPEPGHVPVKRSAVFDRLIGETMHLLGRENARLKMRQNSPSTLGAKVER